MHWGQSSTASKVDWLQSLPQAERLEMIDRFCLPKDVQATYRFLNELYWHEVNHPVRSKRYSRQKRKASNE